MMFKGTASFHNWACASSYPTTRPLGRGTTQWLLGGAWHILSGSMVTETSAKSKSHIIFFFFFSFQFTFNVVAGMADENTV